MLENTLDVSEYTDHVDVASNRRALKARRILNDILEACHIATRLVVASGKETALTQVVMNATPPDESSSSLSSPTTRKK